jgi:hypothetical protein
MQNREGIMAKGLLIASFDFSTAYADEFHDWYDLEHVPEREAVFGFGACERWIGVDDPNQAVALMTWTRWKFFVVLPIKRSHMTICLLGPSG